MIKYTLFINGDPYEALFHTHNEAHCFFEELENDGDILFGIQWQNVTIEDILADEDFEHSYKVEMIASMVLPKTTEWKKIVELEAELEKMGIL